MPLPTCYVIGDSISIQYGPYLESALGASWQYDRKSGDAEARKNLDIPIGANGGDSRSGIKIYATLGGKNISTHIRCYAD